MASSFLDFINDKIAKLCSKFSSTANSQSPHTLPSYPPHLTRSFHSSLIWENKTDHSGCFEFLLRSWWNSYPTLKIPLACPIEAHHNYSKSLSFIWNFPFNIQMCTYHSPLKKHSLHSEDLTSYCPISNLNFLSQIIERIIHSRFTRHLSTFNSISNFQSAYRPSYSTETALLRIQNDLLLAIDQQKVSALVLLDLCSIWYHRP